MKDKFIKKINEKTADEWFNIAFNEKDLNKKIGYYSNCLKLNPKDAYAWFFKGNTLDELKRYDDAIEAYDKATEINPKYASAWINKGIALYKLERYEDTIKAYDKATEINPEYAYAWYNKGIALGELGRYEGAIEAYDKAIKINPEYASAWYNKGIALDELGRYEGAIESFEKAIEIDPKDKIVKKILKFTKEKLNLKEKLKHVEETLIAEEKHVKEKHVKKILITKEKSEHVIIVSKTFKYSVIPIPNIKKHPVVRLCLVQLDFQITDKFPYQLKMKEDVKEKILKALEVATKEKVNIICFPELSFAEEFIYEIKENDIYKDIIIIGGSYYHNNFNVCPVIINGDVHPVCKIHPSPSFESNMAGRGMESGNDIKIFESEDGRFKFVVLICIDYLIESNYHLYQNQKGINFIFNPSFNKDIERFQEQANLDCKNYHVDIIQINVKKYGGTCIIGREYENIIKRLINEGCKKPNDLIKYKLYEAEDEMMIITDFNLKGVEVPTPIGASPRITTIIRYKYENGCWQKI